IGFGQTAISCWYCQKLTLTICGKRQTSFDVFAREVRKIVKNLFLGHPRGQIVEYVIDGDAHASNAWLTAALARLNGDVVLIIHSLRLRLPGLWVKDASPGI